MAFFKELKRRNVFKVASVYLITSWLILQIIAVVSPYLHLPTLFGTIVTVVLSIGLPIACIFAWAFELTPDGLKFTRDVDKESSISHHTGNKINYLLGGALTLALCFIGYDKFFTHQIDTEQTLSIAVLPFEDMSADHSQEYFGDGMAEEILNSLAKLPQLSVISRTSSFAFKDKDNSVKEIASALGVNYILEGSVRKSSNTLRITAQLIEANSGAHLWSQTYDRPLADIFTIQDNLTYAITQALQLNLLPEQVISQSGETKPGMTTNQLAYDLFIHARELQYLRTTESLEQAEQLLNQAIDLDPNFLTAKAQLYTVYHFMSYYGVASVENTQAKQEQLFNELVVSDQVFAMKYLVIGYHMAYSKNLYQHAAQAVTVAAKLNPSDPIIQNLYTLLPNMINGDVDESIRRREARYQKDPLDLINTVNLLSQTVYADMKDKAIFYLEKLEQLNSEASISLTTQIQYYYLMEHDLKKALNVNLTHNGKSSVRSDTQQIRLLALNNQLNDALTLLERYANTESQINTQVLETFGWLKAYVERFERENISAKLAITKLEDSLSSKDLMLVNLWRDSLLGNLDSVEQWAKGYLASDAAPDKFNLTNVDTIEFGLIYSLAFYYHPNSNNDYFNKIEELFNAQLPRCQNKYYITNGCVPFLYLSGDISQQQAVTDSLSLRAILDDNRIGDDLFADTSLSLSGVNIDPQFKAFYKEQILPMYAKVNAPIHTAMSAAP
ncbi:hypothetical protein Q4493_10605 [Colwellia sp. 1_MG-2023]|uniref:hypothetical protein n=1 Tax=Colwellia sp. 1_MG-2023 TaxID=3062649 RepID=UPI0026E44251|nr:hypothetical protein [Colwellia sp. 1_MG-2023]MDO6446223.1 hypothetical protein [Colwellia sp. 1_MG-2023]